MTRAAAARQLGQLLSLDLVGGLLDDIRDPDLRDLLLKAIVRARQVAGASSLEPPRAAGAR